jgi:hypothetical protein
MSGTVFSHGTTTNGQGQPLLLQDSSLAATNFGINGIQFLSVPKSKFMFYVRFLRTGASSLNSDGSVNIAADIISDQNVSADIGFVVKHMDRPRINFETETINQYNKKRVIQKKVTYNPIQLTFHDTIDNQVYRMFQSYFEFYFADSQHSSTFDWTNDVISSQIIGTDIGWGFIGSNLTAGLANYFTTVEVYQVFSGYYNQYDLINPKFLRFEPDQLDYSDGQSTNEITLELAYEGVNFVANGAYLGDNFALIDMMGLDRSDFYEPFPGPITGSELVNVDGFDNFLVSPINALNGFTNTLNNAIATITSPLTTALSIGGALQGTFSSDANSLLATSAYGTSAGILGSTAGYNVYNSGISAFSPNLSASAGLRGVGILI